MLNCIGIDDENFNNKYLKECCNHIPFINLLDTFTDPFAAVQLLQSGKVDLIFLDFHLGGITANEFIRELGSTVKVIIVSSELAYKIRDQKMDIIDIVHKPYSCERLLAACKIALNKSKII
jgi:two-component SAPR family response regulator